MNREIKISPAWDRKSEGYGVHAAEIHFIVKDETGALVWTVYTGWYLAGSPSSARSGMLVNHLYVTDPHVDFDTVNEECGWLDGEACMCTFATGLEGDKLYQTLIHKGSEAVFECLEVLHKEHSP